MAFPAPARAILRSVSLLGVLTMVAVPVQAHGATQARLVRCGPDSCLRLSGHRPRTTTAVRIGERDVAVDGGRVWRATVPLSVARNWPIARGYSLHVVLIDRDAGTERSDTVMLPPGALGSRTEIASLVVSAG